MHLLLAACIQLCIVFPCSPHPLLPVSLPRFLPPPPPPSPSTPLPPSCQAAIDRFSSPDSDTFAFLLSTKAGGLGITLTAVSQFVSWAGSLFNWRVSGLACWLVGQAVGQSVTRMTILAVGQPAGH